MSGRRVATRWLPRVALTANLCYHDFYVRLGYESGHGAWPYWEREVSSTGAKPGIGSDLRP